MNPYRRAYTLVELLAVIAVIGMLAALLFPVFAQARRKARQTVCVSNLRQIGVATLLYQQDHDGLPPRRNPEYRYEIGAGGALIYEGDSALERYGLGMPVAHCPTAPAPTFGYGWRLALSLGQGEGRTANRWVRPEPGSVLAYCYRHLTAGYSQDAGSETYHWMPHSRAGSYLIVRGDGSAATVPAGSVAIWKYERENGEDVWHAPPAAQRGHAATLSDAFDVFPGEPWPPRFVESE